LLDELRAKGRAEGRSLNAVAVDVLRRGLGKPPAIHAEIQEALGSMIARPAIKRFDPVVFQERARLVGPIAANPDEDLEWARGDR
jgi:hypothetical protein